MHIERIRFAPICKVADTDLAEDIWNGQSQRWIAHIFVHISVHGSEKAN